MDKKSESGFKKVVKDMKDYHSVVKEYGLKVHDSHMKGLPFLLKLFLALIVDVVDGLLGFVPGLNMVGTIIASFCSYALWGDVGFVALWEFVPELVGSLGVIGHPFAVILSCIPTVFGIGVLCCRPSQLRKRQGQQCQADQFQVQDDVPKRELNPIIVNLTKKARKKFGYNEQSPQTRRQINPELKKIWNKIRRVKNV